MQTSHRLSPAAHGPDYERILGSGGVVERAQRRFIAAGFSPRKPLLCGAPRFHALALPAPAPPSIPIFFARPRTPLRLAA
ncbi:MAG: hypothetical protein ABJF10_22685 [Chthoniobacter sp.]|uniref:hypothetical protein n=1 Tax=Chthoniobacter sp. TaxID=2510640 RepID=UPI0032ABEE36